jgi:hypothetical protein
VVAGAYGQVVAAAVAVIGSLSGQITSLEAALTSAFCAHPDAAIVQSQPGLGVVLGARVLAEFGDDPIATPAPRPARPMRAPPDYPRLRPAAGGVGPGGRQPAAHDRLPSVGVRRVDRLAGCPPLLRCPSGSWRHSPSGAAGAGQPAGRDPARLPAPPSALRRAGRMAHADRRRGRLTSGGAGGGVSPLPACWPSCSPGVGGAGGASCPRRNRRAKQVGHRSSCRRRRLKSQLCFGGDGCVVTRQVSEPALACGDELRELADGPRYAVGAHRGCGRPGRP